MPGHCFHIPNWKKYLKYKIYLLLEACKKEINRYGCTISPRLSTLGEWRFRMKKWRFIHMIILLILFYFVVFVFKCLADETKPKKNLKKKKILLFICFFVEKSFWKPCLRSLKPSQDEKLSLFLLKIFLSFKGSNCCMRNIKTKMI